MSAPLEMALDAPLGYLASSELEKYSDKRIAGRGMMLHKDAGDGKVPVFLRVQPSPRATIDSDEFAHLLMMACMTWTDAEDDFAKARTALIAHIDTYVSARLAAAGMVDKRDAERYRFLKNCWLEIEHPVDGPICEYVPSNSDDEYNEEKLDAAIDAAMSQDHKGG